MRETSFQLGGLQFTAQVDPTQIYLREDLCQPGFFKTWDLPIYCVVGGLRLNLLFRRAHDLRWHITTLEDYPLMRKLLADKVIFSFNKESKVDQLCCSASNILAGLIKADVDFISHEEVSLVNSLVASGNKFLTLFSGEGDYICINILKHLDSGVFFILPTSKSSHQKQILGVDSFSSQGLSPKEIEEIFNHFQEKARLLSSSELEMVL